MGAPAGTYGAEAARLAAAPCSDCDAAPGELCWRLDGSPRPHGARYWSDSHRSRWTAAQQPDPGAVVVTIRTRQPRRLRAVRT